MTRTYRTMLGLIGIWLAGWMYLSWAAIQDDAMIHLRYADNLFLHHFITYDGVHRDYGASSLLYVAILALLRGVTASPDLPRAVSSAMHGLLFLELALGLCFLLPGRARTSRLAGLVLLILQGMPSAVRWLDDGMETGTVAVLVCLLAFLIHGQTRAERSSPSGYLGLALLAFLAVLLRMELLLLCSVGFVLLVLGDNVGRSLRQTAAAGLQRSHLMVGAGIAVGVILMKMHVLLPDTALAKSHGIGHWSNPIHDTAVTLGGAFSFGTGMLLFWLLTLGLAVFRSGRLTLRHALANSFPPVVLLLSALRGQEIQGVRYFAWTFFFAIVWNLLELAQPVEHPARSERYERLILYAFLAVLITELPFEAVVMHRVLTRRAEMMRTFEAQHLEVLHEGRGVASDIGYIGYFTKAEICDLAGLVNGRAAASMSSLERAHACLKISPDFVFLNVGQLIPLMRMADLSRWEVCGRYEFTNVTTPDTHYLLVRPEMAAIACHAASQTPEPIESILPR